MRLGDRESYFNYMRMSPEHCEHLLSLIKPLVTKETTNFRESISAGERLSITLRFLVTGESQQSLSFAYRIGIATLSKIVQETCDAIYEVLAPTFVRSPKTKADWCMVCPANTRTLFHNYKGYFSLQFLGISDSHY